MIDFRPILFVVGILLTTLAVAMLVPFAIDVMDAHPDWQVFAGAGCLTLFIGVVLILTNRVPVRKLSIRQAFVMTTMSWLVLTAFAALPFAFSDLEMSYTDSFFEAMSGITTTGSTVIVGLDAAPKGILIWRALLQWLGGVGIIVMAISVMPILRVGGMQLFRVEAFEARDKVLPRAGQIALGVTAIYIALTGIWWLGLWLLGADSFHAVAHAMTTIATGGFSSSDNSAAFFQNPWIEVFLTAGMVAGALPFLLYLRSVREGSLALFRDSQVHWFLAIAFLSSLAVAWWLWARLDMTMFDAAVASSFNVVSIMTGTGYASADFQKWGTFPIVIMFVLMFVGGCAGSTSCGIKIFRFQVLHAVVLAQIRRLMQPHGVFVPRYNRQPITDEIAESVMVFVLLYFTGFGAIALLLGALGLDFLTAVSGAATAISNVGPGLGHIIGPAGTFAALPDAAKWVLSAGMLLGRLELFTVLVLFLPSFWRG
jgi:trk system potassium uptake protein TrkH